MRGFITLLDMFLYGVKEVAVSVIRFHYFIEFLITSLNASNQG